VLADRRLHAADHARAAADGDRRRPRLAAPSEHRLDLRFVARKRDNVGDVVEAAAEGANDVAVGLSVGVGGAIEDSCRAELREPGGRLEARRRKLDVLERDRQLDVRGPEAEMRDDPRGGASQLLR
jgi:hypothetical protein